MKTPMLAYAITAQQVRLPIFFKFLWNFNARNHVMAIRETVPTCKGIGMM